MEEISPLADTKEFKQERKSAVRIIIEGRVQKVGFRNWMQQQATQMHVNGWVRNKNNGSVEAFLYGNEESVRNLIQASYCGPAFASVKRVKEFPEQEVPKNNAGFAVLPSG